MILHLIRTPKPLSSLLSFYSAESARKVVVPVGGIKLTLLRAVASYTGQQTHARYTLASITIEHERGARMPAV